MSKFFHDNDDIDDAKAIAIPWVFSENSQAKNDLEFNNQTYTWWFKFLFKFV